MWCSASDTHLKLLYRVVIGACFLAGGVLSCDLSHRLWQCFVCCTRSGVTRSTLCGALPVPYVPVRVTRGDLISHRYTFAPPRCRTSKYRRTFISLSVSLWNDLVDPVYDGVGRSNAFLLAYLLSLFLSSTIFRFSSFPL